MKDDAHYDISLIVIVVLLHAGFEPVTLGVRVKLLKHWATEEPL